MSDFMMEKGDDGLSLIIWGTVSQSTLGVIDEVILDTLLDEMERSDKEVGLATLCVTSGMGAATIVERV